MLCNSDKSKQGLFQRKQRSMPIIYLVHRAGVGGLVTLVTTSLDQRMDWSLICCEFKVEVITPRNCRHKRGVEFIP